MSDETLQLLLMLMHYCEIVGQRAGIHPQVLWGGDADLSLMNMLCHAAAVNLPVITLPMVLSMVNAGMEVRAAVKAVIQREQGNLYRVIDDLRQS